MERLNKYSCETSQLFKREIRLVKPEQYKNVFNKSKRISNNCFTILAKKNSHSYPRLGLAISKKNIKLAVHRNRIKRLIREYFRKEIANNIESKKNSLDYVVMAKKNINSFDNKILNESLSKNFQRLQNFFI